MDAHTIDLSVLPAERRRFLAGVGRRLTPQHLARRDDGHRYPVLLTLVTQSAVNVLDEMLLLFDQALTGREAHGRPDGRALVKVGHRMRGYDGCLVGSVRLLQMMLVRLSSGQ
jgi:hypothetical protein